MKLSLVVSKPVNGAMTDGYLGSNKAWFTREQIGTALEYNNPSDAVSKIHRRHKERLDKFAGVVSLSTPGGTQTTYVYNQQGVFEICRWSKQPKADMVMDALYDMAEEVLRKGYFSILPNDKLLEVITERAKQDKGFLLSIDKQAINKVIAAEDKERKKAESDMLYLHRDDYTRDEYRKALRAIWDDDLAGFRKEWDFYWKQ